MEFLFECSTRYFTSERWPSQTHTKNYCGDKVFLRGGSPYVLQCTHLRCKSQRVNRFFCAGGEVDGSCPNIWVTMIDYDWDIIFLAQVVYVWFQSTKSGAIAVITVEPAGKASFVLGCIQTRLMGQYNGNWPISLVYTTKPLITVITAISRHTLEVLALVHLTRKILTGYLHLHALVGHHCRSPTWTQYHHSWRPPHGRGHNWHMWRQN